jgi:hypothetical protein
MSGYNLHVSKVQPKYFLEHNELLKTVSTNVTTCCLHNFIAVIKLTIFH